MINHFTLKQQSLALLLFSFFALSGCSSVGPYVEPADPDNQEGPGLFTGEKGYLDLTGKESSRSNLNNAVTNNSSHCVEFLHWKKAQFQGKKSAEYQEFLQWLKFQRLNQDSNE